MHQAPVFIVICLIFEFLYFSISQNFRRISNFITAYYRFISIFFIFFKNLLHFRKFMIYSY